MIENAEEIFPDSLDGPMYERHIDNVAPNDSEDNLSSVTDSTSNPSSPLLLHQTSTTSTKSSGSTNHTAALQASPSQTEIVPDAFPYHHNKFTAAEALADHSPLSRRLSAEKPGRDSSGKLVWALTNVPLINNMLQRDGLKASRRLTIEQGQPANLRSKRAAKSFCRNE